MSARMSRTLAKSECPLTNILCTPRPVQQAREHSTCFLLLVPPSLPRPSQDFQPAFQLRASFQILLASFPLLGAPSKPQPGIHSERTSANLPKPLARKRAQLTHRPRNRDPEPELQATSITLPEWKRFWKRDRSRSTSSHFLATPALPRTFPIKVFYQGGCSQGRTVHKDEPVHKDESQGRIVHKDKPVHKDEPVHKGELFTRTSLFTRTNHKDELFTRTNPLPDKKL